MSCTFNCHAKIQKNVDKPGDVCMYHADGEMHCKSTGGCGCTEGKRCTCGPGCICKKTKDNVVDPYESHQHRHH